MLSFGLISPKKFTRPLQGDKAGEDRRRFSCNGVPHRFAQHTVFFVQTQSNPTWLAMEANKPCQVPFLSWFLGKGKANRSKMGKKKPRCLFVQDISPNIAVEMNVLHMELLTLNEIPGLSKVFSDNQHLYVPLLHDEVPLLRTLLYQNHSRADFGYDGTVCIDGTDYGIVSLPTRSFEMGGNSPIEKEVPVDGGACLNERRANWLNVFDFVFSLGESYIEWLLIFKKKNKIDFSINGTSVGIPSPIDPKGFLVENYCQKHSSLFLHPITMIHEYETPQFFIKAFQKKYNAPFEFVGRVYEDEYASWCFIDATRTTLGQVFFLGASWWLNVVLVQELVQESGIGKSSPESLYQYSAWLAYESDFPQKWPWSKTYDGSEPDLVIKHMRNLSIR